MKAIEKKGLINNKTDAGFGTRGSITVEAAIALPVFMCVVVSIAFLIKVVYTHEIMQHAIAETAYEMSSVSYLYHVSGLQQTHDEVRDGLKSRGEIFKANATSIADSLENLRNASDIVTIIDNTGELLDTVNKITEDPVEEMKNIACFIASGIFEDKKTQLFIPLVKLYMDKHLAGGNGITADERLRRLNVVSGMDGIDFNNSSFFEDESNDIDIVVKYRIDLPVPIKVIPGITIIQRATVKAWLGGDTTSFGKASDKDGDDIWSLDNFERGRRLREIFGANLPFSFPVIARFDGGTATMIKSMDLTAKTYQNKDTVMDTIEGYIDAIRAYQGQEKPWGKDDIVIKNEDINRKELILVIPKNAIASEIRSAVEECVRIAASKGIVMKVEEYGVKKAKEEIEQKGEE